MIESLCLSSDVISCIKWTKNWKMLTYLSYLWISVAHDLHYTKQSNNRDEDQVCNAQDSTCPRRETFLTLIVQINFVTELILALHELFKSC